MLRIIITLISLVLASCVQTPPLVDCTSRTDCPRNEVCQDGQCLVNTTVYREPKKDEPVDAGQTQPSSDTGVAEDAAAAAEALQQMSGGDKGKKHKKRVMPAAEHVTCQARARERAAAVS